MELMAKVSKGSKMDQIYLPKNRIGFEVGNYVIINLLEEKIKNEQKQAGKLYFYGVKRVNSVKLKIVEEIMDLADKNLGYCENIIITGSFLDEGFNYIMIIIATAGIILSYITLLKFFLKQKNILSD